jgi:2-polyprenyl-3-methyl-5-hydroxy-6-metoxy-1,4-benzoquinol methylase
MSAHEQSRVSSKEGPAATNRSIAGVVCPGCGESSAILLSTSDMNRKVDERRFVYHRCPRCDLVFLSPFPSNLQQYYPDAYYALPSSQHQLATEARAQGYKLDIIRDLVHSGRLLEIGSAYGAFAYQAKMAGFEVEAIEMDERCCRFLVEMAGVRAYQSDNPRSTLGALGRYDVIALWHAIEHLPDPWALLAAVPEHLSPGGIVVISTPNPASWQFRILRHRWTHLDAPRHLQLIPIALMESRMTELGMSVAYVTCNDRGGLGWNIFGWKESLASLSSVVILREALRMMGRVAGRVVAPIERSDLRGSTYTIAFRK